MCMPGTGRVVTYMVTHLYMYNVPKMKKYRLAIIALYATEKKKKLIEQMWVRLRMLSLTKTFYNALSMNRE